MRVVIVLVLAILISLTVALKIKGHDKPAAILLFTTTGLLLALLIAGFFGWVGG